jgi:hypothetical protein
MHKYNIRPKQNGSARTAVHKMCGLKLTNKQGAEEAQPTLNHDHISWPIKNCSPK